MATSMLLLCVAAAAAVCSMAPAVAAAGFYDKFDVVGARDHVRVLSDDGKSQQVALTLDRSSGSGFTSKDTYLFGEFSVQMKLVGGNSAGTVTSFYLSSGEGEGHDEIDIEFMGNLSGDPYVMNTNVWANGDGKKEHQFYLWFDPTADYHVYKIIWNPKNIIFQVDDVPVRTFKKYDDLAYPQSKPMRLHATLWDGSYWATRHGDVKIDWSGAPFVVSYRGYSANACVNNNPAGGWSSSWCPEGTAAWISRELDGAGLGTVAWAERNYMSYNYCADGWRFPQGFPAECSRN
ncbi:xyloglucan endotransglycosylase/hydrolase protein 8 [Oryza brachyantha]|nr:xyloglucan endotransglycosylase/hydrolase protein 8 [Oryza brachyantha]